LETSVAAPDWRALSPALYRQVVDAAPNGIVVTDGAGRIIAVNRQTEKQFGYTRAELLGQPIELLVPERLRGTHPAFRMAFVAQPQARAMGAGRDLYGRRKDGSEFPVEVGLNPLPTRRGLMVLGAIVDISERKALEAELRLRLDELARDDQQKNEFLAMLGHELRNPLAPMSNAVRIMSMQGVDAATARAAQDMLARQLQHLVRLVDDLLDVGRILSGKIDLRRVPIDVNDAVRRGIETAQPVIQARGHTLVIELAPEALPVDGDLVRLSQVVANLLTNAARYSARPGRIWVRTRPQQGRVAIAVSDEGVGIDAAMLPHIFGLFVQAPSDLARSQGGLGIGLTLVKRITELHGGTVTAASGGMGQGAEFVVDLPASELAASVRYAAPSETPFVTDALHRRVLVVDDNIDAAESIATILRLSGYRVQTAYTGRTALAVLPRCRPDVMVLDIGLPDMSGYDVARAVRASPTYRRLPVVAVTGYGQQQDRDASRAAGIDLHLTKPVDLTELQSFIATA
jgi:two-component system CheB/CheR fusion protein